MKKKKIKFPKKLAKHSLVEIHWDDHYSSLGWTNEEKQLSSEGMNIKSVGFYVGFNETSGAHILAISSLPGYNNEFGDCMHILSPTITYFKVLRQPSK